MLPRNRSLTIVLLALAVRIVFVLWAIDGAYIAPQVSLSERYFQEGYAIAAGWGYTTDEEPLNALSPMQQRVERGAVGPEVRVPKPAGFYGETLHPPGHAVARWHRNWEPGHGQVSGR